VTAVCGYVYCRAVQDAGSDRCPVCGFPRDPQRLREPDFLLSQEVAGLPPALMDMHQILPATEGVAALQLLAMERLGIERALLQSAPDQARSLWGNDKILALARQHPERFWASHFLDPRQPGAAARLAEVAAEGTRVVKLLPPAGFAPDDPAFDGFWAAMQELGLVAMVHTGFITARHKEEEARAGVFLSSRWANPLFLDLPARKFPRLTFILCHLGGGLWYEEAAHMVTHHGNVWGDVSGFGLEALKRLLALRSPVDWGKVFWGNDSPPFAYPFNLRLHLAALREAGAEGLAAALLCDNGRRFAGAVLA
jgi:predicted TIM-barrel fold metal-dependent hydrolase